MQGIRILVVDDEPRFRENLHRLLTLRGFSVQTACCGEQALEILADQAFDVAVVDMRMTGIDGNETMRRINELVDPPSCILLTGHVNIHDAVEGFHCGATEYLLKPCSTEELTERILRVYERRREQQNTCI